MLNKESLAKIQEHCPDMEIISKCISGDERFYPHYPNVEYYMPILWWLGKPKTWTKFTKFDPNQCDSDGTPMISSYRVQLTNRRIEEFVNLGLNLTVHNAQHLQWVFSCNSWSTVQTLIDYGLSSPNDANMKALNVHETTAIHIAQSRRAYVRTICATFLLSNLLVKDLLKLVSSIIWRSARYPDAWKRVCDD